MRLPVVFLGSAEQDLKRLKGYIIKRFGKKTWETSYLDIKTTVRALSSFPFAGSVPAEVRDLNLL